MGIFLFLVICATDFRGVWIPRWSITHHDEIFACLDGRFNHIFLQVFAAGEAYYPSQIAPQKKQFDAWLVAFLNEAHRRNIKVSAWINTFYSWGFAPWTFNLNHPINRNPTWFVHDQSGRSILDYGGNELQGLGVEGYYLTPANDQVRTYLSAIIKELLAYDFDGIHLDYVRYPHSEFIYDPALRSKFVRQYYIDPQNLFTQADVFRTRLSLWGYEDLTTRWFEFINDDLTSFIADLHKTIKRMNPNIQISVAAKANYVTARNEFYQNWAEWLNVGYIDFVCLMAYTKNIKPILHKTLGAVKKPNKVMVGLGLYLLTPAEVAQQVALVNTQPFSGVVFFSYEDIKKNKGYLSSLK